MGAVVQSLRIYPVSTVAIDSRARTPLRSLFRAVFGLAVIFAAIMVSAVDPAEAHTGHTRAEIPATFSELTLADLSSGLEIVGKTNPAPVAFADVLSDAGTSDCDQECCSLMACCPALIGVEPDLDARAEAHGVAETPPPVTATPTPPEGLRRPPRHLI